MPKTFFIPIWSPGNCTLFLSSVAFETGFTSNVRVVSRVVVILCLLDFLPSYYTVLAVKEWPELSAEEPPCRYFLIFLFRVTLASFLFFNAALLKEGKCKSVC